MLEFVAESGRSYEIQSNDALDPFGWTVFERVSAVDGGLVSVPLAGETLVGQQFFRLLRLP